MRLFVLLTGLLALLTSGHGQLVINEIHYHPPGQPEETTAEFIEILNTGTANQALAGWRLTSAIQFEFTSETLQPGDFLVVAADPAQLRTRHPEALQVTGPWTGKLSNAAETIRLRDAANAIVDEVSYADDGDWAVRGKGPVDFNHRGWEWSAAHDGEGKTLELRDPQVDNRRGQAWTTSLDDHGSPGRANPTTGPVAPMLLQPGHEPVIPTSSDRIHFHTEIQPGTGRFEAGELYFRRDGEARFQSRLLQDDGEHGDGAPNDGRYGATLLPQPHRTIIEFYFRVTDNEGRTRRHPPLPSDQDDGEANFLLQVLDEAVEKNAPVSRHFLIMTEAERARLKTIGTVTEDAKSNAMMNATFISASPGKTTCRYNVGVRNRGNTSRWMQPNNYRINFQSNEPWEGRTAIDLNGRYFFRQVAGSRLHQLAGVPANDAIPVTVQVNGTDLSLATTPSFGHYAQLEVFDGDFADRHFPSDPDGNLYTATFEGLFHYPRLTSYALRYKKKTNQSLNDYTDLQSLTDALWNSPDESYLDQLNAHLRIDQWLRFFAINIFLENQETNITRGRSDDFALYRGLTDQRFFLLPKDLDAVLTGKGVDAGLFNATGHPAIKRFLEHPAITPRFYSMLRTVAHTSLRPETVNQTLDSILQGLIPDEELQGMKDFARDRREYVLSIIPRDIDPVSPLPRVEGAHQTSESTTTLSGTADAGTVAEILVNGHPASLNALTGAWTIADLPLFPGENRVLIEKRNLHGGETVRESILIRRTTETLTSLPANIRTDTTLSAEGGPYLVSAPSTVVRPGATLTIEPGTTIYFDEGETLLVAGGQLKAEGTPTARIQFTRLPGGAGSWKGLGFTSGSSGNTLTHADLSYAGGTSDNRNVIVSNSEVLIENVTWPHPAGRIFLINGPRLTIRNCEFPELDGQECIGGYGTIDPEEWLIIEGNTFQSTTGYSDIIDWSGGKRPGPILQVLNNVFLGGSDEVLDLDGCDAHIEGNIFMNIRKDNGSTSTSNAISTGEHDGNVSDLTIVRNLFLNCDHALLLKNGGRATFENNTVIGCPESAINFGEPERGIAYGAGAIVRNSIFYQNALDFENVIPDIDLVVDHCRVNAIWHNRGTGNTEAEPEFVDFDSPSDGLTATSPLREAGWNGLDLGARVPAGVHLEGLVGISPPDHTLHISGPGVIAYRYALDGHAFGAETPVSEPLLLTGLAPGPHTLKVVGRNSAGIWQPEEEAAGHSWTVASGGRVVLNEILAHSESSATDASLRSDYLELWNAGDRPVDLSGYSLTDNPLVPRRYTFVSPAMIEEGAHLLLKAQPSQSPGPGELGFGFKTEGEALYLIDPAGQVIDQVVFGSQIPGFSIGRKASGNWTLTYPTPGAENHRATTSPPQALRLNEWATNPGIRLQSDFIEIANTATYPVDLGGLSLTDAPVADPQKQILPSLSFIQAGGYLHFSRDSAPSLDFGLDREGGWLALASISGEIIDQAVYHPQEAGSSSGRITGEERADFQIPTPGSANEIPSAIDPLLTGLRIVEIHYNPPGGIPHEFVELR
ncbi:MAG: lamin tail domain-containing protein, partial [Verrucomicrobiota bacterium]